MAVDRSYEKGQKDGSQATPSEKFIDYLVGDHDSPYGKGFQNGWDNHAPSSSSDEQASDGDSSPDDKSSDSGGCFLTTACVRSLGLADDCVELATLREFRDGYLASTDTGRVEIEEYYKYGPRVVRAISSRPDADQIYRHVYHGLVKPCVALIRQGNFASAHELYRDWFRRLSALS